MSSDITVMDPTGELIIWSISLGVFSRDIGCSERTKG